MNKDQSFKNSKVLILGAQGMLGSTLFHVLNQKNYNVIGTVRKSSDSKSVFSKNILTGYAVSGQLDDIKKFENLIQTEKPDFVINCIGIIKQLEESKDKSLSIQINSLWPHTLSALCKKSGTHLIHFSTDCVFSGNKGNYKENDPADARDVYGLTKYLGEVDDLNAVTLRTSIVGHELTTNRSLFDWFLSQGKSCAGYTRAMYSGLTTQEIANFLDAVLFPAIKRGQIYGLYHLSSEPISKFDLLKLVARVYEKQIEIKADEDFVMDRTLDSTLIQKKLGYMAPSWEKQIQDLFVYYKNFVQNKSSRLE